MTSKQARVLLQALLVSASMAAAAAQGTKNSIAVAKPSPSPTPVTGTKTSLPAATQQRKAGGDPGINPCFKPAGKSRKAGGDGSLQPCFNKPVSSTMRKAGGEQQALCTNEKGKSALNGDGKSAEIEMRKAGGDPKSSGKTSMEELHRSGDNSKTATQGFHRKSGDAGVVIAIRPNAVNGDGKTAKAGVTDGASRKTGGTNGFICDGAKPSAAKARKAGGQGIVRPNCSSATKGISGSTGGAAKPDVPQTPVPK